MTLDDVTPITLMTHPKVLAIPIQDNTINVPLHSTGVNRWRGELPCLRIGK